MNLAIIPARGGSVRVPRKNIRDFRGKPMMRWPIEAAKASGLFSGIVVSTDDDEISDLAIDLQCWVCPRAQDDGTKGTQEIAAEVLERFAGITCACVIYPCSPLLTAKDICHLAEEWRSSGKQFARTVLPDGSDAGAMYWGWRAAFVERVPLEGNTHDLTVSGARFIDINTHEDWARAESMFDALRRAS